MNKYKQKIENTQETNSLDIIKMLKEEDLIHNDAIDSLNSNIMLLEMNIKELTSHLETHNDKSEVSQLKSRLFIVENLYKQKEQELIRVESQLKEFKKTKYLNVLETKVTEEMLTNSIMNSNLIMTRAEYTRLSKSVIHFKKLNNEKQNEINIIDKEIEIIKNPHLRLGSTAISETNLNSNSNSNFNNDIKAKNQYEAENRQNNIISKEQKEKDKLDLINKLEEELKNNKMIIEELNLNLRNVKETNTKLSSDISNSYNLYNNKLENIYKLEIEIEECESKIKKRNNK